MEKYKPTIDDNAKLAIKAHSNTLTDNDKTQLERANVIEQIWDDDIKSNVICELPITVPEEILLKLRELALKADYKSYFELNLCDLQEGDVKDWIVDTFLPYEEIQTYAFLKLEKHAYIWPHFDPNRHVNIYIPLIPEDTLYAPLEIYYKNKIYGIPVNTNKVYAWNTKMLHGVFNQNLDRYNLQMSIYIPYQEFYKKYRDIIDV